MVGKRYTSLRQSNMFYQ
uniref:Uncharacterized protein n=1 Tax=Anguilla anguilla TaxID=7936 RepID=A0A0E9S8K4_ANGAN